MHTIPIQKSIHISEQLAIFNSLKAAIEQQEGIMFLGVLNAASLKVNDKKIEVKDFKAALLYAKDYFAVVLYHFKKGLVSYQFDLLHIDQTAVLTQKITLSGEFELKFTSRDYTFNCNVFSTENAELSNFHRFTQEMAAQSNTETDLDEKWLQWAFRSLLFGFIALFAFWVIMGLLSFSYDHVNSSSRVFIIFIPFGLLYGLLKGTLVLKILYFLSFVGVVFLTFLGAIADAKKGRELIENLNAG